MNNIYQGLLTLFPSVAECNLISYYIYIYMYTYSYSSRAPASITCPTQSLPNRTMQFLSTILAALLLLLLLLASPPPTFSSPLLHARQRPKLVLFFDDATPAAQYTLTPPTDGSVFHISEQSLACFFPPILLLAIMLPFPSPWIFLDGGAVSMIMLILCFSLSRSSGAFGIAHYAFRAGDVFSPRD